MEAWEMEKISYQQRYIFHLKRYEKNPNDLENLGHLRECIYVLINIFGLNTSQIQELEWAHCGLTNDDINSN